MAFDQLRQPESLDMLGYAEAAWPMLAGAQQAGKLPTGVLLRAYAQRDAIEAANGNPNRRIHGNRDWQAQ